MSHGVATSLIPWLDPNQIIIAAGPWAVLVVALIIFAETGLLVGFVFPGDTLLIITGLLTFTGTVDASKSGIQLPIWLVGGIIALAAFAGGETGYGIGRFSGPRLFERKDSGLFSRENVDRTNAFFERFGGFAIIAARFVPIVRTFAPVAAGIGKMPIRRYTLDNAIGAVLWGFGLTFGGFLLGYNSVIAKLVVQYIDVVMIGAVLIALVPTVYHVIKTLRKNRRDSSASQ